MAQRVSNTTTDHDTIRRWAEERGGKPAEVASTARDGDTGIIRIDFPGFGGEGKLSEISWDDWFAKFDEAGLALVYEETTAGGERSNFNKLVARETAEARSRGEKTNRRTLRSGGRTGTKAGGRRQASRMEAARATRTPGRARKSTSTRGTAARSRKATATAGRPRAAAKRTTTRKTAGRTGTRSRAGK